MKSREEIKKWLLKNCIDDDGSLNLRDLDFSDFDGIVDISGIQVKGNLIQNWQIVGGDLDQSYQDVKGNLDQSHQDVKGDLIQYEQTTGGNLYNIKD